MPNAKPHPPMTPAGRANPALTVVAAVLVILLSALWIWRTEFATRVDNVPLQEAVGKVLAQQTARVIGPAGKIVIVLMDLRRSPELRVQVNAFQKELKRLGNIAITDRVVFDPGDNPKYRPGSGLSARKFLKIARKNRGADAIVSFIGAPRMSAGELAELNGPPKLIAETHSPEKLTNLFERKILVAAVVPRFDFPAPGPKKPQTGQQWFERYYQILGTGSAIPQPDNNP